MPKPSSHQQTLSRPSHHHPARDTCHTCPPGEKTGKDLRNSSVYDEVLDQVEQQLARLGLVTSSERVDHPRHPVWSEEHQRKQPHKSKKPRSTTPTDSSTHRSADTPAEDSDESEASDSVSASLPGSGSGSLSSGGTYHHLLQRRALNTRGLRRASVDVATLSRGTAPPGFTPSSRRFSCPSITPVAPFTSSSDVKVLPSHAAPTASSRRRSLGLDRWATWRPGLALQTSGGEGVVAQGAYGLIMLPFFTRLRTGGEDKAEAPTFDVPWRRHVRSCRKKGCLTCLRDPVLARCF